MQADKALERSHFDTNATVIFFGKTANMGAMHDSYMEFFAKCIFLKIHMNFAFVFQHSMLTGLQACLRRM